MGRPAALVEFLVLSSVPEVIKNTALNADVRGIYTVTGVPLSKGYDLCPANAGRAIIYEGMAKNCVCYFSHGISLEKKYMHNIPQTKLNTTKSAGWPHLIEFLVLNLAFGRHRHYLYTILSSIVILVNATR